MLNVATSDKATSANAQNIYKRRPLFKTLSYIGMFLRRGTVRSVLLVRGYFGIKLSHLFHSHRIFRVDLEPLA